MNELISRVLRPLTVLFSIGAVAAFALLDLPNGANLAAANPGDSISVSSTTAGAPVQIQAVIAQLPTTLAEGSSIVLYLEDNYFVTETIATRHAWFTVSGAPSSGNAGERRADAGLYYPTAPLIIGTGDYFGGDDDTAIRVYIPDLFSGDTPGTSAEFQGPVAGETLTLTIHQNAGIWNPSEAGSHSLGYSILAPGAAIPRTPQYRLPDAKTYAKISLSTDRGAPGQVVTVIGSGFNDGVSALLYVKHYANDSNGNPTAGRWIAPAANAPAGTRGTLSSREDPNAAIADSDAAERLSGWATALGWSDSTHSVGDIMTPAETCADIIDTGTYLEHHSPANPGNIVGRDDRVTIEFTVANPPFRPGNKNLLCMGDGEGRRSGTDVEHFTLLPSTPAAGEDSDDAAEHFNLNPSIRLAPNPVNAGNTVTVFADDFPPGSTFWWLEVVGRRVIPDSVTSIGSNGKGILTFTIPAKLQGRIKVEVCYAAPDAASCHQSSTVITVKPAQLSLRCAEVRPNESIVIRGSGFGKTPSNTLASAQIGDIDLMLVSHGGDLANVEVSDRQFTATFAVWPADHAGINPALHDGELWIDITDQEGFSGRAYITILTPTLTITPYAAGPGGFVTISGANWPVANSDGGAVNPVKLEITGGGIDADTMNAPTDAEGNWSVRYRVPGNASIPGARNVKATYGAYDDIIKIAVLNVPAAALSVSPATVSPGEKLTLNAGGFTRDDSNITVKISDFDAVVPTGAAADAAGRIKDLTVTVPPLDAGIYTVQLQVGDAVAIGAVTVPGEIRYGDAPLPDALAPLGDNLVRVFHLDNDNQTWLFYDPRPEFVDLNTLNTLSPGLSYWILVRDSDRVMLNATAHNLTYLNGNCWSRIVW